MITTLVSCTSAQGNYQGYFIRAATPPPYLYKEALPALRNSIHAPCHPIPLRLKKDADLTFWECAQGMRCSSLLTSISPSLNPSPGALPSESGRRALSLLTSISPSFPTSTPGCLTFWKWAQGMRSSSLLTSISSLGISSIRNVLLAMMFRQSSRMSSFCIARILLLITSNNLYNKTISSLAGVKAEPEDFISAHL